MQTYNNYKYELSKKVKYIICIQNWIISLEYT
jgi:hypothetical protein